MPVTITINKHDMERKKCLKKNKLTFFFKTTSLAFNSFAFPPSYLFVSLLGDCIHFIIYREIIIKSLFILGSDLIQSSTKECNETSIMKAAKQDTLFCVDIP